MPSILNLKFKGNKSFVPFSNLNDAESLTKTWKVCTKVASYLEQGSRLENLSWRLWHLQSLMVDSDNAKSKREFKKLSKCMSDKLDKEKGRNITELEAPDFKRSASIDLIQQRAVEKERHREASQNAKPGTIDRMQFTFSVDQPIASYSTDPVQKPDLKPSPEFNKRVRAHPLVSHDDMVTDDEAPAHTSTLSSTKGTFHFPSIFSNDFGPAAMLGSTPTFTTSMTYGEDISSSNDGFGIARPTIELPLDELMTNAADSPDSTSWMNYTTEPTVAPVNTIVPSATSESCFHSQPFQMPQTTTDITMLNNSISAPIHGFVSSASSNDSDEDSNDSDDEDSEYEAKPPTHHDLTITSSSSRASHTRPVAHQRRGRGAHSKLSARVVGRSSTPTGRVPLSIRTSNNSRSSGPSATATNSSSRATAVVTQPNSAPGGVKAECQNCGATHTPLWRRGLNDELNCNACGLYCKLHKRPRPKTMRNGNGETRAQATPRQEQHHHHHHHSQHQPQQQQQQQQQQPTPPADVAVVPKPAPPVTTVAQCYNCHTTATPLWRKDDEGKTVCNACGLYYKLHGSARPISMKSDVIRKRSRHDARRVGNATADTSSVSPGASQRASPVRENSPTLAPDSSTMASVLTYDYDLTDYRSSQSELMGALGNDLSHYGSAGMYGMQFPGPYHPDLITAYYPTPPDALPFSSSGIDSSSEAENSAVSPRLGKRRRMSCDSASEPPSSAVSYSSYNSGYSTSSSASHSQRSSLDMSYTGFYGGPPLRSSSNSFWHPPMMPQANSDSPSIFHPPMLPPTEDSPMDFLHPPLMQHDDDSLFSTFLHPPMTLPDDSSPRMDVIHPPMWPTEFESYDSHSARVF